LLNDVNSLLVSSGLGKSRSIEGFATLDFLTPIAEDTSGIRDSITSPPCMEKSARFDYDDLEFKTHPNPLLSDIDLLKHEEIALLTAQVHALKADNTRKQEELNDVKAKLHHLTTLTDLQASGKLLSSGDVVADGDWIPDATTPVKMEAFQSPGVAWSANPMGVQQIVNEHRRRVSVKELKVAELSTETEMQQELINHLKQVNAEQANELVNLRSECNQKTDNNMTLTSRLTESITQRDQALAEKAKLAAEILSCRDELDIAVSTVIEEKAALEASAGELMVRLSTSELLVQQLQQSVRDLHVSVDAKASELAAALSEIKSKEYSESSLKLQVDSLTSEITSLKESVQAQLRDEREARSKQIASKSAEKSEAVNSLAQEIDSLSARLIDSELVASNVPSLRSEVTLLTSQLVEVQRLYSAQLETEKGLGNDLLALRRTCDQVVAEKTELTLNNEKLSASVDTLTAQIATLKENFSAEASSLRSELSSLLGRLAEATEMHVSVEKDKATLRSELDAAEARINEISAVLLADAAAAQSVTQEKDFLSLALTKEKQNFVAEMEKLKTALADSTVRAEGIASLESLLAVANQQLQQVREENDQLASQVSNLTAHVGFANQQVNTNEVVISGLQLNLGEAVIKYSVTQGELRQLETAAGIAGDNMKREIDVLTAALRDAHFEVMRLTEVEASASHLSRELIDACRLYEEMSGKYETVLGQLDSSQRVSEKAVQDVSFLTTELRLQELVVESYGSQLVNLTEFMSQFAEDTSASEAEHAVLLERFNDVSMILSETELEIMSARELLASLEPDSKEMMTLSLEEMIKFVVSFVQDLKTHTASTATEIGETAKIVENVKAETAAAVEEFDIVSGVVDNEAESECSLTDAQLVGVVRDMRSCQSIVVQLLERLTHSADHNDEAVGHVRSENERLAEEVKNLRLRGAELEALTQELDCARSDAAERDREIYALASANQDLETQLKLLTSTNEAKSEEIKELTERNTEHSKRLQVLSSEKRLEESQMAKLMEFSRASHVADAELLSGIIADSEGTVADTSSPTSGVLRATSTLQIQLDCKEDELRVLREELGKATSETESLQSQLHTVERLFEPLPADDETVTMVKKEIESLSQSSKGNRAQAALTLLAKKSQALVEIESQNTILRHAMEGIGSPTRKKSDNYSSFGGPEELHINRGRPIVLSTSANVSQQSVGTAAASLNGGTGKSIVWAKNEDFPNCSCCTRPFNRLSRWR
jgi:chromosome segregation ATPase